VNPGTTWSNTRGSTLRKFLRIFVWCLAGLSVLTAGLFLYLRNADLSIYEDRIEGVLTTAIGHKVDFDGLFELHFGSSTTLIAEKIKLSNVHWEPESTLLSVEHFSVTVNTWSLISRPIVIEDLDVRGIDVRVKRNAERVTNWKSDKVPDSSKEKTEFNPNLIAFRKVRVEDFSFTFDSPDRSRPIDISLESLTVTPGINDILDLDLRGLADDVPMSADGKIGPWQNLLDGQDITTDLALALGQLRLTIKGTVADITTLSGIEAQMALNGPAIGRIIDIFGLPPLAEGAFQLDANIQSLDAGNEFKLDGNLGEIGILASGSIDKLIGAEKVKLDFNFSGPSTTHVAEVFGITGAPDAPFQVSGDVAMDGRRFQFTGTEARIGSNVVSFSGWLDASQAIPDGDITIGASGPDFSIIGPFTGMKNVPSDPFEISGRIQKSDTIWNFDDFRAVIGENRIVANGEIRKDGRADAEIKINVSGPDNTFIQALTGLDGFPPKPFDISATIKPHDAGIRLDGATAIFGDNRIDVDGVIGFAPGLTGTNLKIGISGPELGRVALLTDIPYMPSGPFEAGANLRFDSQTLRLYQASASAGGLTASANGAIGIGPNAGTLDLELSLSGPDIAQLMELELLERLSGEQFNLDGRIKKQSSAFELSAVSATIGNLKIGVDGSVDTSGGTARIVLDVAAPDASVLSKLSGLGDYPAGTVSASGKIERHVDNIEFTDTQAKIGEFQFSANGILSNAPLSNNSDLSFAASGPEISQLGLPFGISTLPAKTFSVSGHVVGIPTGFEVDNLVARVGENDIDAYFRADLGEKPEVTGKISSTYIDLVQESSNSVPEVEQTEVVQPNSALVFSDEPLNLDWLDSANIDVTVETGRLTSHLGDFLDFRLGLKIWDNVLDIKPISFRESDGIFAATVHLEPKDDGYALSFSTDVKDVRLGVMASPGQDPKTLPPINSKSSFESSGASPHEWMAAANGHVSIYQGAGRIRNMGGEKIFGDVLVQLLQVINPMYKEVPHTNVQCGIFEIDIVDGVATTETLAVQTDRMSIILNGNVAFDSEKLDFAVQTTPRKGLGLSIGGVVNQLIKIGGTMRKPQIGIDPVSSATTTGVAVATAGLSLLAKGLWDRAAAEKSICEELQP
jgi:uncharacterized protein involved in outer membrane biogenesis